MLNSNGEVVTKYRKLHTFDITLPDGTETGESKRIKPGDDIVTFDSEIGHLGFSICYDIRFPEMFRYMAIKGAQIIFTPANFAMATGKDHWEPILRARAIENSCYIIAAAQIGRKRGTLDSFGSSMIIDPWGTIICRSKDTPGVSIAEIDLEYINQVRKNLPSLQLRRKDVYDTLKL